MAGRQRHIRPGPNNRDEALLRIRDGLASERKTFERKLVLDIADIEQSFLAKEDAHVAFNVGYQLFWTGCIAQGRIASGDVEAWELIRSSYSSMYWACVLGQHWRRRHGMSYEGSSGTQLSEVFFHSLSLAAGADSIADYVARNLFNLFRTGAADSEINDPAFLTFYWHLLRSEVEGKWYPVGALLGDDELSGFEPLLSSVNDPVLFVERLPAYCDFRLARAYGYENVDATKPHSLSAPSYFFERQLVALFPVELLALKRIVKRVLGIELSLEADHPLLKTPLMQVPPMVPLRDDELSRRLQALGEEVYGADWDSDALVPLLTE